MKYEHYERFDEVKEDVNEKKIDSNIEDIEKSKQMENIEKELREVSEQNKIIEKNESNVENDLLNDEYKTLYEKIQETKEDNINDEYQEELKRLDDMLMKIENDDMKKPTVNITDRSLDLELQLEYQELLENRFESSYKEVLDIYSKYQSDVKIDDYLLEDESAHYNPGDKSIKLNVENDLDNPIGNGATYFHEVGHNIDHAANDFEYEFLSTKDGHFSETVYNEVNNYIDNYKKAHNLTREEAYDEISILLEGVDKYALSDIFSGATLNQCVGDYFHETDYWQEGQKDHLAKETFAHMFEASMGGNQENFENIKKVLPKSFEEFKSLIRRYKND